MYRIENFQTTFYLDRSAPALWIGIDLEKFVKELNIKDVKGYLITEKKFLSEALELSDGKIIMTDSYFIPSTVSKDENRFVLIEVNSNKGDKL